MKPTFLSNTHFYFGVVYFVAASLCEIYLSATVLTVILAILGISCWAVSNHYRESVFYEINRWWRLFDYIRFAPAICLIGVFSGIVLASFFFKLAAFICFVVGFAHGVVYIRNIKLED